MPIITCAGKRDGEYVARLLKAGGRIVGECPGRNQTGDADGEVHVARYEGAVLGCFERNGYDDSDFIAVVWDGERVTSVEYATTRGWTYHNAATVDATDEVKALAAAKLADEGIDRWRAADLEAALTPERGKRVRVVKGRKVPKGTEGEVTWVGEDRYSFSYHTGRCTKRRLRLTADDGEAHFTALGNVEVIDPGQYLASEAQITAKREQLEADVLRTDSWVSAYRAVEAWVLRDGYDDEPQLDDEQLAELEAERAAEARLVGAEA